MHNKWSLIRCNSALLPLTGMVYKRRSRKSLCIEIIDALSTHGTFVVIEEVLMNIKTIFRHFILLCCLRIPFDFPCTSYTVTDAGGLNVFVIPFKNEIFYTLGAKLYLLYYFVCDLHIEKVRYFRRWGPKCCAVLCAISTSKILCWAPKSFWFAFLFGICSQKMRYFRRASKRFRCTVFCTICT